MIKSLYYSYCISILAIYKITKGYNFLQWYLLKYFFYTSIVRGGDLNLECLYWKLRCQSVKLQDFLQNLLKYWRKLIISCTAHCTKTQLVINNSSFKQVQINRYLKDFTRSYSKHDTRNKYDTKFCSITSIFLGVRLCCSNF